MDLFNGQTFAETFLYVTNDHEQRELYILSLCIVVFFLLSTFFAILTLLLRHLNNRKELVWKELHALWDNDILVVLAGDEPVAEFLKKIPPHQELNFIKYLTPYAWLLKGSDLKILSQLAIPFLPHAVAKLEHRNPEIRAWAVNALSLFGMPRYTPRVLQMLRDPSSVVAMSAANALLLQQKVSYIEPVLTYFHRFDQWNLASLTNLISQCGPTAMPILRRILLDETRTVRTRIVAAEALSVLKDYEFAEQIPKVLATATDPELVAAALRLLADVGQTSQRDIVIDLCAADNEVIRVNAFKTLRELGIKDDIPLFRHALLDTSPWVAVQAALGLNELGDQEFLETLARKGHSRGDLAMSVLSGSYAL